MSMTEYFETTFRHSTETSACHGVTRRKLRVDTPSLDIPSERQMLVGPNCRLASPSPSPTKKNVRGPTCRDASPSLGPNPRFALTLLIYFFYSKFKSPFFELLPYGRMGREGGRSDRGREGRVEVWRINDATFRLAS
jgi:hypothetical protein